MNRKLQFGLILVLFLSLVASSAYAQNGSIRGTVYQDTNVDGKCVGTGEPTAQGVPVNIISPDGQNNIVLESGDDGTYGMVAAGLGTWTVGIEQASGWVVTSNNNIQVYLSSEQPGVQGLDFCVVRAGTATPPVSTPTTTSTPLPTSTPSPGATPPAVVLPESGAPIAPVLLAALATGTGLILAGLGIEWRRRRDD